ncbi:hypothetical protein [Gimesia fumaroli]|uniref:Uncharacterized protein n=1 Tax=Gimesia fumaroli TaxID=2527976 RepID=A0A518I9G7_9PLAN|nr:hypothetical protein [Gimesia fumaroli]QDV49740.1 hypothetical protein Enr17x_17610 [Gimesia fumaroli]
MQLPHYYRRGILSPRNKEAQLQLNAWFIQHPILVDIISLNDDAAFYSIWELGVFRKINSLCGCIIDDYEEEVIEPEKLNSIISLIDNEFQNLATSPVKQFLNAFRELLIGARDRTMPVYFIL